MKEPSEREFVVCKITRINPNSVNARLIEYGKEGMIHISEVARGWVKDTKKHVKPGQIVVAKIISLRDGRIGLSLKRVDPTQEKMTLKQYKFEQKAEKMLDFAAKELKKEAEKEIIKDKIIEEFGSLYEAFKLSLKNIDAMRGKGIEKPWLEAMKNVAEKNFGQKEFTLKARMIIKSYKPDGVNIIRKTLSELEKNGIRVKYISAPEYTASMKTKSIKKDKKDFESLIEKTVKKSDIEGEYKIL